MGKVADILSRKGREVFTIAPGATVFEAVKTMVSHNVGSLIVTDGDEVRGIITERDYLRDVVIKGRSSKTTSVDAIMSSELICVDPETETETCMAVMSKRHIRHLPVMAKGKLSGVVSIGDVVKQLSTDREVQIRFLTDYIADKYPG